MSYTKKEMYATLALVVAGWAFDAFDLMVLSFALRPIGLEFGLTEFWKGLIFALQLVGTGIGGALFGVLADHVGRKRTLVTVITLYSLTTGLTAFARNLAEVSLLRFLAGLGLGGEWGVGVSILGEVWPKERRGLVIGITQGGWPIGMALASADYHYVMIPYGWRIGFLVASSCIVLAPLMWAFLPESKLWLEYVQAKRSGRLSEDLKRKTRWVSFVQLFYRDVVGYTFFGLVLVSLGMFAFYAVWAWVPNYLKEAMGIDPSPYIALSWLIGWFGHSLFGWFADKFGRRPSFCAYCLAYAASVFYLYVSVASLDLLGMTIALCVNAFVCGYFSAFGAILTELFPTRVRATGSSFCYNGARGIGGALAPIIVGMLAEMYGLGGAIFFASLSILIASAMVWLVPETRAKELKAIA